VKSNHASAHQCYEEKAMDAVSGGIRENFSEAMMCKPRMKTEVSKLKDGGRSLLKEESL
jgi:hypothetical protein